MTTPLPTIIVSGCLLGEAVRYDGGHKRTDAVVALGERARLLAICPEAVLGTPREPMHLEDGQLLGNQSGRRLDLPVRDWLAQRLPELVRERPAGFVLKNRSPSCAPRAGLFAQAVQAQFPHLPVIDEETLQQPGAREAFLRQVL